MENWNATKILAAVAFGLAVCGIVKPSWPLTAVGLLLLAVAVFVATKG